MLKIFSFTASFCLIAAFASAQEPAAPPAETAPAAAVEQPPAETPAAESPTDQPPAEAPAEPSPEAVAARGAFDVIHQQWSELVTQINTIQAERKKAQGDARTKLDAQAAELRAQADELVDKIVDAGLAVYQADPDAYPEINATLLAVAQFHLTGDPRGDGGDQYEKALPIVKSMLEAGAGDQWPQLYLWGAIAAYNTNDFTLAEQYFAKARETGADAAGSPPSLLDAGAKFRHELPALRKAWEAEQKIRAAEAEADDLPRVKLTTTRGDIVLELFENEAPQSVANFITLVKDGFYDGIVFHRVLPGFMAQGGDPTGTGTGGPGYNIRDEHQLPNARRHFRGSISMANQGKERPNSGSSQFFLTFIPTSPLDGGHAVFGRVIEGMDVAASLKRRDPDAPVGTPDRIVKAEVLRDRGHEYEFEKLPER